MKKRFQIAICFLLIAALLCACGGSFKPEAGPAAKEMMTALENGDAEAVKKLMHPDAEDQLDDLDKSIEAMIEFVDGCTTTELKQLSVQVRNQVGTNAGKYETGAFQAVLSGGPVLKIEYTYLSNAAGSGFLSFYLSIGT